MVLGFYGRLLVIGHCKAYCDLHKCYLIGRDIAERKCNKKKCKYKKELGKYKEVSMFFPGGCSIGARPILIIRVMK